MRMCKYRALWKVTACEDVQLMWWESWLEEYSWLRGRIFGGHSIDSEGSSDMVWSGRVCFNMAVIWLQ